MKDGNALRAVQHGHCAGLLHAAHALAARYPEAARAVVAEYSAYCRTYGLEDYLRKGDDDTHGETQSLRSH